MSVRQTGCWVVRGNLLLQPLQGHLHFNPAALAAMQLPSVPPIRHEVGETTLERQTRIRPSATPPVISD
eukprot:5368554-Pyramimonas_sp.AAC.1